MKWRVVIRPEAERDVIEAARWYDTREPGLGARFVEEVIGVWDSLAENPLLNSRRHPQKNIRWQYPDSFPYCVVYEVIEQEHLIVVAAVLHAARHDHHWQRRF
jgi:plasmid stabilization system protein ParE